MFSLILGVWPTHVEFNNIYFYSICMYMYVVLIFYFAYHYSEFCCLISVIPYSTNVSPGENFRLFRSGALWAKMFLANFFAK